ncbi:MAG TPA: hypothetical protein VMZ53_02525 [Kofleriaceae bacterium]|nr:hypothetical protein [Kofleriaceae bacterium]
MRFACLVAVLLVSNVAYAEERSTVVSVGGAFGFLGGTDVMPEDAGQPGGIGAIRATLAWERPSPEYGAIGKSNFSGSLVPELVVGSLFEEERAEGFVGLGLRAELRAAHNHLSPFGWTYKVGGYLVGRALVLGKSQDATYEFGIGEYFPRRAGYTRAGFELTMAVRPHTMDTDEAQVIGLLSLFAGWAP